jgi:ABC-2 type transport system permease protein
MRMTPAPAQLFHRLRWWQLRNAARLLLERSLARVVTVLVCSLIIWGLLFGASWKGFHELHRTWNVLLNGNILATLFDFMFLALTVMLTFSTAIILYSSLFSSAESWYLLAGPLPEDHVFAYKFQGAVAFSSWAFVLLGSPILIAYGIEVEGGAPWYFYLVLPLFFLGFVLLPGSLGALVALMFVNFLPRHRKQVLILLAIIVMAIVGWRIAHAMREASQNHFGGRAWLNNFVSEVSVWRQRLIKQIVPVQWMSLGLMAAAEGEATNMLYFLALVWSNGLMLYLGTVWLARRLLRRGFNRVATGGTLRKRYGGGWIDNALGRLMFFLDPQTRLLIVKDFRTFRRDPAQWLQILIFLGLAVLYFSNMRAFYENDIGRPFQNGISLLTLTATGFLMCAYTGRFIFPMLSLEGRKFWILGLLPLDRSRLVWGKFAFSAAGCLLLAEFLVLFSDWMLSMPWIILVAHMLAVAVLALGLSGLSVGLGACLPNFRESDPSKIAVGFGGTLNLVAGLMYLIVIVVLMAVPFHIAMGTRAAEEVPFPWWLWLIAILGVGVGALAIMLPLRAGAKNLRRMEF